MHSSQLFERVTIIGLGLIGSSIARAAHERHLAGSIIGCDSNEISTAYARKQGFIDRAMPDAGASVQGSQLVILATPPETLAAVAAAIGPHLDEGAIVMDVASVKQPALDAISPHLPAHVQYVPAHPIAGSEQSGVSAGRANLFEKKLVIITPREPLGDATLQHITSFWRSMGARVDAMPASLHDQVYGFVSHLPQLLAFAAMPTLADYAHLAKTDEQLQRFLRLSASNYALWTEIFLLNKENIIKSLDRYLDALIHIKGELAQAPAGSESGQDAKLAHVVLFPRVVASCLITTVMEAEKKAGFPFARYAGSGFADFTSVAAQPPEEDIERISNQYAALLPILDAYGQRLLSLRSDIAAGDAAAMEKSLAKLGTA